VTVFSHRANVCDSFTFLFFFFLFFKSNERTEKLITYPAKSTTRQEEVFGKRTSLEEGEHTSAQCYTKLRNCLKDVSNEIQEKSHNESCAKKLAQGETH